MLAILSLHVVFLPPEAPPSPLKKRAAAGPFQWLMLAIFGLGNAADAVEILCIGLARRPLSCLLPRAAAPICWAVSPLPSLLPRAHMLGCFTFSLYEAAALRPPRRSLWAA